MVKNLEDLSNVSDNEFQSIIGHYAFRNRRRLPKGSWRVSVILGDAWIFTENQNHVLHPGDCFQISEDHSETSIRSLYTRGGVLFTVTREA